MIKLEPFKGFLPLYFGAQAMVSYESLFSWLTRTVNMKARTSSISSNWWSKTVYIVVALGVQM